MNLRDVILSGNLDELRKLIAEGADVKAPLEGGTTPIQLAGQQNDVDIVRALAHAGADPRELGDLDLCHRLALFLKISREDTTNGDDLMDASELAEWLMEMTEDLDRSVELELARKQSPLFRAVLLGQAEEVRRRIEAGDDVDEVCDVHGDTPLIAAVKRGHEEIFRDLLTAGADVEARDSWGTPLRHAFRSLRFTKPLIDAGADVNRCCGRHDLIGSVIKDMLDNYTPFPQAPTLVVRLLLEAGADPARTGSARFVLHQIAAAGAWEIFHEVLAHFPEEEVARSRAIIKTCDDAEAQSFSAAVSLRQAALFGDVEKLRGLLETGAVDVDDREMGGTALMQAASCARLEAMRVLIEAGADVDAVDPSPMTWNGSTALARACEAFEADKVRDATQALIEAGADVNRRGAQGRTALHHAVFTAHRRDAALQAVTLLLAAGADPELEDELGYTAWMLAESLLIQEQERACAPGPPARDSLYLDDEDVEESLARCRRIKALLLQAGARAGRVSDLRLVGATKFGNSVRVKRLLAAGARADMHDPGGHPVIAIAADNKDDDTVLHLIRAGCDVDGGRAARSMTALERALRRGRLKAVRALLAAGADPLRITSLDPDDPYSAIPVAQRAGHVKAAQLVLDALPAGTFVSPPPPEPTAQEQRLQGATRLAREAAWGHLAGVRESISAGAVEIDGLDVYGRTALMAAAEAGCVEVMEALIEAGADVDRVTRHEAGGDLCPRSTPLVCAAIGPSRRRGDALRLLIQAGAAVDLPGTDDRTALSHAVERDVGFFGRTGDFAVATRTLIEAGTNLEARDRCGLTAWDRAISLACSVDVPEISDQYLEIARILEEAGASTAGRTNVDLVREAAGPPWVAMSSYRKPFPEDAELVARLFAQGGADPDARRHDAAPALILAVRAGREKIASLLIEAGCDVDARLRLGHGSEGQGPTALIEAAWNGSYSLTQLLLDAGADKTLERDPGVSSTTAGALAASRHFDRIARVLGEPRPQARRRAPWDMFAFPG